MKKTYNVSLGNRIFHLEEDAGDKLQNYIRTLENHYSKEEGGSEIMNDIECRIAELFQEYLTTEPGKEVITLADVKKVIDIMGTPNDIIDEDYKESRREDKKTRILYRDVENRVFGGVAGGISAYLNIPVLAVRIFFILLACFYGITILIYIILWIAVPAALTAKQKLEMKGEPINISNIEKNIRDNFNEVKENKKVQDSVQKTTGFIADFFKALWHGCLILLNIIGKIFATFILFICIALLLAFGCILFNLNLFDWATHGEFMSVFMTAADSILLRIVLVIDLIIPLILLIWLCTVYLFNIRKSNSVVPLSLFGLWIVGIIFSIYLGFSQGYNLSQRHRYTDTTVLSPTKPSLVIMTTSGKDSSDNNYYYGNSGYYLNQNSNQLLKTPELSFEQGTNSQPELLIVKRARGASQKDAYKNAQKIEYSWRISSDTLYLSNYFKLDKDTKWKAQEVDIILRLPENYIIYLPTSVINELNLNTWRGYVGGNQYYTMKDDRLELKSE